MRVGDAKRIAQDWVEAEGINLPGFAGAFYHGSAAWLDDNADLPATSDLDVLIATTEADPAVKPGKFRYRGLLLEVSYIPLVELLSPEEVLAVSHLAGDFRHPGIISDPTGQLTRLQEVVGREFARRRWVVARGEHALGKIRNNLRGVESNAHFYDQVGAWLFGTGVMCHVLLVAGLRNPTVRKRYVAVRELLAEYGHEDYYPTLLALLGADQISRDRVAQHLDTLEAAFDAAAQVVEPSYQFHADLSADGRQVAIDGSRELIAQGDHREAIFWIVATYCRCIAVLDRFGTPELLASQYPGFQSLLAELGIVAHDDLRQRAAAVSAALPRLWTLAQEIIAANPQIES